jgi:ribosome-associated toxin RatA of RatAB toxin-antitoxin module
MEIRGLVLSVCLALASGPLANAADATGDLRERLEKGQVVALEMTEAAAGGAARMQLLVDAPARAVWEVIVSCDLAFRFIAGLQVCEIIEDSGNRVLVRQVIDRGWLMPTLDFVFESSRQPWERIDVELVSGNLERLHGRWRFTESAGATLVEHQLTVRPSAPVPRFLVRHNLRRTMPDLLACVRGLAGGSGNPDRERDDLQRCRGPGLAGP